MTIRRPGHGPKFMNPVDCIYCGAHVDETIVPDVDDDDAWEAEAQMHNLNCEWVLTRAHRLLDPLAE